MPARLPNTEACRPAGRMGTIIEGYQERLAELEIEPDAAQSALAARLDALQSELMQLRRKRNVVSRLFGKRAALAQGALYLGRRGPRQDDADGPLLRRNAIRTEAACPLPRIHGGRPRSYRDGPDERSGRSDSARRSGHRKRSTASVFRRIARHRYRRRDDPRDGCSKACSPPASLSS